MIKLKRMESLERRSPDILYGIALTTGKANRHILLRDKGYWESAAFYDDCAKCGWGDNYTGPRRFSLKKQWS